MLCALQQLTKFAPVCVAEQGKTLCTTILLSYTGRVLLIFAQTHSVPLFLQQRILCHLGLLQCKTKCTQKRVSLTRKAVNKEH